MFDRILFITNLFWSKSCSII